MNSTILDRKQCPQIRSIENIIIQTPERRMMPNGVPLNIIRAGNEEVVRMDILINAGIWHQKQPLQALFTNRMLREGTQKMSSAQISEQLDYYGAWLELTSSMNYNFLTLYSLNKHFERTLAVLGELIKEPTFPNDELQVTIDANRQQFIVNSTKVDVITRKEFNSTLFGKEHPCGRFAVAEDYDKLTSEHLKEFYSHHYHSGNCSIYLSGKVTDHIISLVEKEFGIMEWGNVTPRIPISAFPVNTSKNKHIFAEHPTAVQSALRVGSFAMDRTHPDYAKARVLVTLFGGYFGSRLMTNIREDKGYTYGITAGIASYPHQGVLVVNTETANEYVEPTIKEIKHEMQRLQNELVPQQELSMVQSYMLGEMCRNQEGAFSLSDAWIFIETAGLSQDFFTQMTNSIRNVTREELRELACVYLQPEKQIEVITGKKV